MVKTTTQLSHWRQTDAGETFVDGRDYRALLVSQGHRFRDGRWTGEDNPFHVYRERERPGMGVSRTFYSTRYWIDFTLDDPVPHVVSPHSWACSVSRSFSSVPEFAPDVDLPDPGSPDYNDYTLNLNAQGTSFIRRNRPGNPVANLGQFVGELHELPRIPIFLRSRVKHFADLGSEYLNIEFGWKPFVKDLIDAYKLQQTLSDRINKLRLGNGLALRRRSKHRGSTVEVQSNMGNILTQPFGHLGDPSIGGNVALEGYHLCGPFPYWYSGQPPVPGFSIYDFQEFEDTVVWECGTFYYYVPDIGTDRWTERAKAALFGVNPTPSVLYELFPWSWLIDWFANVGDIISNASESAVDNEVLTNCFAMKEISSRFEIACQPNWDAYEYSDQPLDHPNHRYIAFQGGSESLTFSLLKRQKMRRQASPYGFGLKAGDLTLRQQSILAAIALSKRLPPRVEGALRYVFRT